MIQNLPTACSWHLAIRRPLHSSDLCRPNKLMHLQHMIEKTGSKERLIWFSYPSTFSGSYKGHTTTTWSSQTPQNSTTTYTSRDARTFQPAAQPSSASC